MNTLATPLRVAGAAIAAATVLAIVASPPAHAASQQFVDFTAGNGASADYHYYPASGSGGLLIYLDGEGQWGHENPADSYALGGKSGIAAQGNARGLNVLSARTPSGESWNSSCSRNAAYLTDLIADIRAEKKIASSEIWLTGFSGGAQFITTCYLPAKAEGLGSGGAIVFGGGGAPSKGSALGEAAKRTLSLHWVTGSGDTARNSDEGFDALAFAKAGASYYAGEGFTTSTTWVPGVDHDSISGRFGGYIGQTLDAARSTAPAPAPAASATATRGSHASRGGDKPAPSAKATKAAPTRTAPPPAAAQQPAPAPAYVPPAPVPAKPTLHRHLPS